MNNIPRQKLQEIVTQYGHSVYHDPKLCKALLKDFCGQYRKEIAVLVGALEEGIPAQLLASKNTVPHAVLIAQLIKKLQENLALTEEAARWAVESWVLALGVNYSPVSPTPKREQKTTEKSSEKRQNHAAEILQQQQQAEKIQQQQEKKYQLHKTKRLQRQVDKQVRMAAPFICLFIIIIFIAIGYFLIYSLEIGEDSMAFRNCPNILMNFLTWSMIIFLSFFPGIVPEKVLTAIFGCFVLGGAIVKIIHLFKITLPNPLPTLQICSSSHYIDWIQLLFFSGFWLFLITSFTPLFALIIWIILKVFGLDWYEDFDTELKLIACFLVFISLVIGWQLHHALL